VPFEEDEEAVDTPMAMGQPDPKAPAAAAGGAAAGLLAPGRLGINILAKAVPTVGPLGAAGSGAAAGVALDHRLGPEDVVLCFGIIDILQVTQLVVQVVLMSALVMQVSSVAVCHVWL
jgi:hypothetical protein